MKLVGFELSDNLAHIWGRVYSRKFSILHVTDCSTSLFYLK